MMTKTKAQDQEQIAAIQDMTDHAHSDPLAASGHIPMTNKMRRAQMAAKYSAGKRNFSIDTNYRAKAARAAKLGEVYDEAADRIIQAKKLAEQAAYKRARTQELSAALQERFNTAPEHIMRSRQIRAQQDAAKKAKKLSAKLNKAASHNVQLVAPKPQYAPVKQRELVCVAS